MVKLCVKNFGPIVNGFSDNKGEDYIEFKKTTIFIGEQGSGKSTIAKLFSTLSWIEKNLSKGKIEIEEVDYNFFIEQLKFHKIESYFSNKPTFIDYKGENYNLTFDSNAKKIGEIFSAKKVKEKFNYTFPKIMYVPSERNFLSSIENTYNIKYLPLNLNDFLEDFENAKLYFGNKGVNVQLIDLKQKAKAGNKVNNNDVSFVYDKSNNSSFLQGNGFQIKLSEASSGYQSSIPVQIVSEYLTKFIHNQEAIEQSLTFEDKRDKKNEIDNILAVDKFSDEEKESKIESINEKYSYKRFVNVVEEPEQNLFPKSQKYILYKLLECVNDSDLNQLVITTHSPYLLMHLTLAIKAKKIYEKENLNGKFQKVENLVPFKSAISSEDVVIYQLDDEGNIKKLEDYNGLPTDENYLNELIMKSNDDFTELLKIESDEN